MTESLAVSGLTGVRLHADEEPSLEVGERIEVEEEVVDLVLRDDIVRGDLALVVLRARGAALGAETARNSPRKPTHLQHLEILDILSLAIEDLPHDHRPVVRRPLGSCWFRGNLRRGKQNALLLQAVQQLRDRVDDLKMPPHSQLTAPWPSQQPPNTP